MTSLIIATARLCPSTRAPDNLWEYCRLPIGQVLLKPSGTIQSGTMRMDLWQAEIRGTLRTDSGEIRWRTLAASDEKVIIIELETTEGERDCALTFRPEPGNAPSQCLRMIGVDSYIPNPEPVLGQLDGCNLSVQPLLAGGNYVTAWQESRVSPNRRLFFLSVGYTQYGNANREAATSVNRESRPDWSGSRRIIASGGVISTQLVSFPFPMSVWRVSIGSNSIRWRPPPARTGASWI